ncbi:MAG: sigma-70 family RNA polymerase sigma factor [Candidatus Omnitrophica bacterium]|nr:sigma-70 family RNA polymerase sigma factor [Candidatus Omnitrophota bacterium]
MFQFNQKNKDNIEFEENLMQSFNSLYNLAYRLTMNREEANDLVQEASLRAFRFYNKYEQGTNFKAWILTILRNTFINQYRKINREPSKVNYHDLENYVSSESLSSLQDEVFGESLQKSIDLLPEELKSVINLFYVEGFSYKEIAQVMRCPIGTVMSRLHTARQILKQRLIAQRDKHKTGCSDEV